MNSWELKHFSLCVVIVITIERQRAVQTLRRQSYSHYHLARVMLIKHI
jgi:hypothetical protein